MQEKLPTPQCEEHDQRMPALEETLLGIDSLHTLDEIAPDSTAFRITSEEGFESVLQSGALHPYSTIGTRVYRRPEKYTFAFPCKTGLKKWVYRSQGSQKLAHGDYNIVHYLVRNALWRSKNESEGLVLAFPIDPSTMLVADYATIVRHIYKSEISDWEYLSSIKLFKDYRGQYLLPELLAPNPIPADRIRLVGRVNLSLDRSGYRLRFFPPTPK